LLVDNKSAILGVITLGNEDAPFTPSGRGFCVQRISMKVKKTAECNRCGKESHHTHHKDHNHRNNKPNNLERLCTLCHVGSYEERSDHKEHVFMTTIPLSSSLQKDKPAMSVSPP